MDRKCLQTKQVFVENFTILLSTVAEYSYLPLFELHLPKCMSTTIVKRDESLHNIVNIESTQSATMYVADSDIVKASLRHGTP